MRCTREKGQTSGESEAEVKDPTLFAKCAKEGEAPGSRFLTQRTGSE